jgi:hypothetical protein
MKIGIVGVGTASAVAVSTLLTNLPKSIEVTCFYNPDIPITHVGESASAAIYGLMYEAIRFDPLKDLDGIDGTLRYCTKYNWTAAHGEDFTIRYAAPGLHVNSEKFSAFVFKRLEQLYKNFTMVPENVKSITQVEYAATVRGDRDAYSFDYVIDCRGTPSVEELNSAEYNKPQFVSVNSVILYPDFQRYDEPYTSSYIHDNGWMFGVPLQHRKAWGYLYNNTITSLDEAKAKFAGIKEIDTEPLRKFSWTPYYKTQAQAGRILSMGNRLYFFEPHQAIPLHFYMLLTKRFCEALMNTDNAWGVENIVNRMYLDHVEYIQDLIAINYVGENKLDTPFWRYAIENGKKRLHSSDRFVNWSQHVIDNGPAGYAFHGRELMREYIDGYRIDLSEFCR